MKEAIVKEIITKYFSEYVKHMNSQIENPEGKEKILMLIHTYIHYSEHAKHWRKTVLKSS